MHKNPWRPETDNVTQEGSCGYGQPRRIEQCIRQVQDLWDCSYEESELEARDKFIIAWEEEQQEIVRRHVQAAVREWPYCHYAGKQVNMFVSWIHIEGKKFDLVPYFYCSYCDN